MISLYDYVFVDLVDLYVNVYKIGFGDIIWIEILKYIFLKNKFILLVIGVLFMEDVDRVMDILKEN